MYEHCKLESKQKNKLDAVSPKNRSSLLLKQQSIVTSTGTILTITTTHLHTNRKKELLDGEIYSNKYTEFRKAQSLW